MVVLFLKCSTVHPSSLLPCIPSDPGSNIWSYVLIGYFNARVEDEQQSGSTSFWHIVGMRPIKLKKDLSSSAATSNSVLPIHYSIIRHAIKLHGNTSTLYNKVIVIYIYILRLYIVFIDITKAFDCVIRRGLFQFPMNLGWQTVSRRRTS